MGFGVGQTRCACMQALEALFLYDRTEQEDHSFVAYVTTQWVPQISTTDSFEKVCVDSRLYSLSKPVTTRQRHHSGEAFSQLTRRVVLKNSNMNTTRFPWHPANIS